MPKNNLSGLHYAFFHSVSGDEGGAVADGGGDVGDVNHGHGLGPGMIPSS